MGGPELSVVSYCLPQDMKFVLLSMNCRCSNFHLCEQSEDLKAEIESSFLTINMEELC